MEDGVTQRRPRDEAAALLASFALLVLIWWPFLASRGFDDHQNDWTFRANYLSYAVTSLARYHAVPFWASAPEYQQAELGERQFPPHAFFSNPETEVLSPYLPLFMVLDFAAAVKVSFLLHLAVGVVGFWLLLDVWQVRHPAVVVLSEVLLFGGAFFVRHILIGHFQFVSFTYFPLALWFYWRTIDLPLTSRVTRASLAWCAGVLALAFYEGNAHLVIQFGLVLALLSTFEMLLRRRYDLPLKLAVVLLVFSLIAAFKLLPAVADYGSYTPTGTIAYWTIGQFVKYALVLFPTPPPRLPHEVSLYCGITGATLIAAGILSVRRRNLPLALTAAAIFCLMLLPVAQELRAVPVIGTQRLTRLRGFGTLLAVALTGDMLMRLAFCLRGRLTAGVGRFLFAAAMAAVLVAVVHDEASAVAAVLARYPAKSIALHDAIVTAPAVEMCTPATGELSTAADGPNGFSVTYRGEATAATPASICFPRVSAREAARTLSFSGPGTLGEEDGRLVVTVRSPGTTTFLFRSSSLTRSFGFVCTLAGVAIFSALIARQSGPRRGVLSARQSAPTNRP